jgi:predicted Zn-dependent protease
MRASAAHEFGHALGIEGHSTNPNDLMSIYYGHGVVSANDAATIRYLYHLTPDLIP